MQGQVILLGGFSVRCPDGATLAFPTRKAEALLAYLACHPGEPQTRDRLAALLWGDRGDEQARHSLSQALSALRQLRPNAPGWFVTNRDSVCLRVDALDIDVVAFRTAAGSAALQADAVALYRGPLLDGITLPEPAFEEWLTYERAQLQRLALGAALQLADSRGEQGDTEGASAALQCAIAIDPLTEDVHRRLIAHHLRAGAFNEAIRGFRECRDLLRRELDTLPEPSTTSLYREATRLLASAQEDLTSQRPAAGRGASLAVMPFVEESGIAGPHGSIAPGLVYDVITRLAKLRSLRVTAQGSVFALRLRGLDPVAAGQLLGVDYVAGGSINLASGRIRVRVELVDTRTAHIVWADVIDRRLDDTLEVLEEIGNRLVVALAGEIEVAEQKRAVLKPPNSLTAWEAHHRGLWHMYRFNAADNERAQDFFRQAVRLDPTFSRAYAGLSFTHFQNAFLLRPAERQREAELALELAGESLNADALDPAAHWSMGRALWLRGDEERCLHELGAAVDLSPNFAQGHYTLGFVHCQSGDPAIAIESVKRSGSLSPYDPLKFGMLAARGLAHVRRGEFATGADWAVKATTCANAHTHILAIAAYCLAVAGRMDQARAFQRQIRTRAPNYGVEELLSAFRFVAPTEALFRDAARRIDAA